MASSSTVKDITEENRKFFNEVAANYNQYASHQKVIETVADAVLKHKEWSGVAWDEDSTRMLDYGCGTGLISKILAPYTKQLIGMDLSEGMVQQFNQSVQDQGIPKEEMRAIVANLCADELDPVLSDPDYNGFDVVLSTLAFHHMSNVPLAIKRAVERLKKETGVLLIIDHRTHEPVVLSHHHYHHQHKHSDQQEHLTHENHQGQQPLESDKQFFSGHHTVTHNGFSEEDIKRWYEEAGLVDVDIVAAGPGKGMTIIGKDPKTGEVINSERSIFMAKGRRA